jgi:hypothetical protein
VTLPGVASCQLCDAPQRGHAVRWHPQSSWHTWQEPDAATRKARIAAILRSKKEKRDEQQMGSEDL